MLLNWHNDKWLKHFYNLFFFDSFCQFRLMELELTKGNEIQSGKNVAAGNQSFQSQSFFSSISNNISSRMNHFWIFTSSRTLNVFHGNHSINRDCASLSASFSWSCGLYFLIRKSLKSTLIKRVFCVRWKIDPNQNTITLELRACVCLW